MADLSTRYALVACVVLALGAAPAADDNEADEAFFIKTVEPILRRACFECHGADLPRVKGGLLMASTESLRRGGDSGPAIVAGNPGSSRLMRAVRWSSSDLQMPPAGRLPAADVEALARWIGNGASWPVGDERPDATHSPESSVDVESGRSWWAFRPVEQPPVPPVPEGTTSTAIDAFLRARLAVDDLQPGPPADRRKLVRRAYLDLIGLPPTYAELEAAAADQGHGAWERLVDRLLASPRYGERWGRHWLDVVRYAQTNGYEEDGEKPFAWRYRDYVIRAFNEDKPYDLFLAEQIAGDELDEVTNDGLVATGLFHLGVWDAEPDDRIQADYDVLDDSLRVLTEGFLGVTVGCARCHDHKFDPFPQADYYGLLAFLRNLRSFRQPISYALSSPVLTPLGFTPDVALLWETQRWERIRALADQLEVETQAAREQLIEERLAAVSPEVLAAYRTPPKRRSPEQRELIKAARLHITDREVAKAMGNRLFSLRQEAVNTRTSFRGELDWALTVRELSGEPLPTQMLIRGLASNPGPEVAPHFVRALCATDDGSVPTHTAPPAGSSSGRRRALAEWIIDPAHPTTARVLVNRVWLHHFGRGLVASPNDFGRQGSAPSHPELLDWLAADFVRNGWSIKHLHRLIMASDAYRRSSIVDDPRARQIDPDNTLLWRQNPTRLDAEVIRDSALAVSGELRHDSGGRGFFPRLGRQALGRGSRPGEGWGRSSLEQRNRRSIYAFSKRSMVDPLLEAFDLCSSALPVGARLTTTLPSQALATLNGDFMNRQAAALARRVRREVGADRDDQITRLFELVLARHPSDAERVVLSEQLQSQALAFAALRPTLAFQQDVPSRVDQAYLEQLSGEDILQGPRQGWSYLRGVWNQPYNATVALDRDLGPAALLLEPVFADGRVTMELRLRSGCELVSFLLRADPDGERFHGVELRFDPAANTVAVVAHAPEPVVLAQRTVALTADAWHGLVIEASGTRVTAWLDGMPTPVIDVDHDDLRGSGCFGVRTWGEVLQLADLELSFDGRSIAVPPDALESPADRSLQSVALLMLNLDEFVHVD